MEINTESSSLFGADSETTGAFLLGEAQRAVRAARLNRASNGGKDISWLHVRGVGLAEKLALIGLVCDAIIIVYALMGAFWLRFASHWIHFRAQQVFELRDYTTYIAVGAVSLICVLSRFGLYEKQS